jgi:hypothetical protein
MKHLGRGVECVFEEPVVEVVGVVEVQTAGKDEEGVRDEGKDESGVP